MAELSEFVAFLQIAIWTAKRNLIGMIGQPADPAQSGFQCRGVPGKIGDLARSRDVLGLSEFLETKVVN